MTRFDLLSDDRQFFHQVSEWMKATDIDNDGKLTYKEFNKSLKKYLHLDGEDE